MIDFEEYLPSLFNVDANLEYFVPKFDLFNGTLRREFKVI